MPNYRRVRAPGHAYFFTLTLAERGGTLLTDRVDLLRRAYADTISERPVRCPAMVVMPDHLHAVWTLPEGDSDYATRWMVIKARFTHGLDIRPPRTRSQASKRERGIWQRRYWEHAIRDETELRACVAYCWMNPVKHGFVRRPVDWPYSSFHRAVRDGMVTPDWCGGP